MKVGIVDIRPESRAALSGRVNLALEEAGIKEAFVAELNLNDPGEFKSQPPDAIFIGPGSYSRLGELIEESRAVFKETPIALVLENEIYGSRGVALRKRYGVAVMPLGDVAHMAGFLIDCQGRQTAAMGGRAGLVIGVAQLKGGVGATTVATSLGSCWARHGLSAALLDFDDVNPQVTAWARVGSQRREVVAEFLRRGQVPIERINEIVSPIEGYDGKLIAIGQPILYNEGFHYKADVLENSPSSGGFVTSMLQAVRGDFDATIIDLGRSWGVSTFSVLPHCSTVLFVTDDDGMSVRQSLDNLQRLRAESGNSNEFDFSRWNVVLNAYTGRLIDPGTLANEISSMNLLPPEANLYTIPFSERGRQWGAPGQSLFDLAEDSCKQSILRMASNLCPFDYTEDKKLMDKLVGRMRSFIS